MIASCFSTVENIGSFHLPAPDCSTTRHFGNRYWVQNHNPVQPQICISAHEPHLILEQRSAYNDILERINKCFDKVYFWKPLRYTENTVDYSISLRHKVSRKNCFSDCSIRGCSHTIPGWPDWSLCL